MTKSAGYLDFSDMEGSFVGKYNSPTEGYHTGSCYTQHPALSIGGGTLIGGNCRDHDDHSGIDLYVALDSSMQHPLFEVGMTYPRCVYYPIRNLAVPKNPEKFSALIDLICETLVGGKRVHVGCIGGHGRTGMVIAAVAARLNIDDDPIAWVRANYCKKAVETKEQGNFLVINFGCKPQPESHAKKKGRGSY